MKEYELITSLAIVPKELDEEIKKKVPLPSFFMLDGTEEEIFNKLKLQLCFTFGMLYEQNGKDRETEVKKLKKKYKIK